MSYVFFNMSQTYKRLSTNATNPETAITYEKSSISNHCDYDEFDPCVSLECSLI